VPVTRVILIAALVLSSAGVVRAQTPVTDELDAVRRALAAPDFSAADLALDRAAQQQMTTDDLATWLELRVLVSYADERLGTLEESLTALASFAPGRPVPSAFPRAVQRRFEELRALDGRIRVGGELTSTASPESELRRVGVIATILDDPGHLVRRTRVRARVGTGALLELGPEARIDVRGDRGQPIRVEYVIEAFGPGDALLASAGTESMPLVGSIPGMPRDETPLITGLVVGGVAVTIGVVVLVIAGIATDGFRGETSLIHTPAMAPLVRF
jgi:hypothetical protein